MRYLIAFLFFCIAVGEFAEEELQEKLLSSSPKHLSGLMLRQEHLTMSGQVSLKQIDLIAKGAQNIVFFRSYIPSYIPLLKIWKQMFQCLF